MENLLKLANIQILNSVKDWIDAVYISTSSLVEQGYCTSDYPENIIKNTYEMGPYYVLCENFALLHARSEQGAIKKQLAVTVLKEPVYFKEGGHPVRILVTLVAEDSESHISAIQAIGNIFSDPAKIQMIIDAQNTESILELFMNEAKS